mmetsp:Transcript_19849/g.46472  ORF Transcript_19849/g.46472 Transcript_19849/m.46472 type:complete len:219 (-) Transcript_19849:322-978(-)
MSLRCLAILGSKNEPLYICAAGPEDNGDVETADDENGSPETSQEQQQQQQEQQEQQQTGRDHFGFFDDGDRGDAEPEAGNSGFIRRPASLRHEMMIHAAIDRIEELVGSHRKVTWKRFQRTSHWIGQVCPMEEYDIYGYVTTSDVKILALLDRDEINPLKKRKEVDIKIMFTTIHDCYVRYTLNPFSKIRGKIQPPCTAFEKRLQFAMDQYNIAVDGK